jgi:hypothetical protein
MLHESEPKVESDAVSVGTVASKFDVGVLQQPSTNIVTFVNSNNFEQSPAERACLSARQLSREFDEDSEESLDCELEEDESELE